MPDLKGSSIKCYGCTSKLMYPPGVKRLKEAVDLALGAGWKLIIVSEFEKSLFCAKCSKLWKVYSGLKFGSGD